MPKPPNLARAKREARTYVKSVRAWLLLFEAWPRDPRAWARHDRIDALLSAIESSIKGPRYRVDAYRRLEMIYELEEWLALERAWVRDYPTFQDPIAAPPSHWTRRDLSPSLKRKIDRAWKRTRASRKRRTRAS